tara:strand:+ start:422 stop:679 length:258 start_codon:yes stop_codon:yes gene_type:complete
MSELTEEQFLEMTNLHSPETFSVKIELMAVEMEISHLDAIFHCCDEEDIDLDIVHKLVNKSLKDKLEVEARELNFLPQLGSLPLF